MAEPSTASRRIVAALLTITFLLSACSSTPSDGSPSDASAEAPPLNAPLAFVDTDPTFGTISSVAPTSDESDGPELAASPDEMLAWDWGPHAPAPIAQFDAYRVPGTPTTEAAWTGQFLQFNDDEAASCVDGPLYQPIRNAFGDSTRHTFQVDGQLWQFVVLDPRTYPLAVERC